MKLGQRTKIVPGTVISGLTITRQIESTVCGKRRVEFTCHCGKTGSCRYAELTCGRVKSCGCMKLGAYVKFETECAAQTPEWLREKVYQARGRASRWDVAKQFKLRPILVDFIARMVHRERTEANQAVVDETMDSLTQAVIDEIEMIQAVTSDPQSGAVGRTGLIRPSFLKTHAGAVDVILQLAGAGHRPSQELAAKIRYSRHQHKLRMQSAMRNRSQGIAVPRGKRTPAYKTIIAPIVNVAAALALAVSFYRC